MKSFNIDWVILKIEVHFEKYPINVECLQQAIHIDWVKFPNFENFAIIVRNEKSPINVECLQQGIYIDWVKFPNFSNFAIIVRNEKCPISV